MAVKNFETNMSELENIVRMLETSEEGLDKTLELYEKGVKLAAVCNKMLDDAEQKISVLAKTSEGLGEVPFANSEE